jgi:hypothetical protein
LLRLELSASSGSAAGFHSDDGERWFAPLTTMQKAILWFAILILAMLCREASARGSLILGHEASGTINEREALRNEHLYEQVVAECSHNPTRFDHLHPILGELLTDRTSFEYWLNRWQANPTRFEHWHPRFWRIIDGEALEGGPPVLPPLIPSAGQGGAPPAGLGPPLPPEPPGPPGPVAPVGVVPEPGSFLLLVVAVALILAARGCRFTTTQRSGRASGASVS